MNHLVHSQVGPSRLGAFSILPTNLGETSAIRKGKSVRKTLTWLETNDASVEIGYRKSFGDSPEFWLYLNKACVGYVTFAYALTSLKLAKWFPDNTKFAVPHCTVLPIIRGKGYASFIYEVAMRSGIVLYSWEHTLDASKLWESLATKVGAQIYQFDTKAGKFVAAHNEYTVKVLSLIKPNRSST